MSLIDSLHKIEKDRAFSESEIHEMLKEFFPDSDKGELNKIRIMEASAIAFYHQETGTPVVKLLICDDAPQFKLITENMGLCWVHDGRHYKRLTPVVPLHRKKLKAFCKRYWKYYAELITFKKNPTSKLSRSLSIKFDLLFSKKTGYVELDERIAKTKAKKDELLTVLNNPEIPLHNNLSENAARVQKRREDVSLHTLTDEGTKAKDTMMSIVETCKKLGISAYEFIHDRVSQTFKFPSLAEVIKANVKPLSQQGNSS